MNSLKAAAIIYNPNSTGESEKNAKHFATRLQRRGIDVTLLPTRYAGHATTLAKSFAIEQPRSFIVSSSGDGGYHEVINGILQSGKKQVIAGVLPSGNANDHFHALHHGNTARRATGADIDIVDVLELRCGSLTVYAHSYIGFGATPQIGQALNKTDLNPFNEKWIVAREFFRVRSVRITDSLGTHRYHSLICSNISRMSKILTLSESARADDGLFEITRAHAQSLWHLLGHFLRRSAGTVEDSPQKSIYQLTLHHQANVQLDGEVYTLPADTPITIRILTKRLRVII